jgi:hypothetical protein
MYNFYFGHLVIWSADKSSLPPYICKICEQCYYHFVRWSTDQMNKIKVVDLRKLLSFVVDNFFIWIHFVKKNYVWIF